MGIFYFNAYAHWNPQKMARHQLFVKALMATGVKVVFGKFKKENNHWIMCGFTTWKWFDHYNKRHKNVVTS